MLNQNTWQLFRIPEGERRQLTTAINNVWLKQYWPNLHIIINIIISLINIIANRLTACLSVALSASLAVFWPQFPTNCHQLTHLFASKLSNLLNSVTFFSPLLLFGTKQNNHFSQDQKIPPTLPSWPGPIAKKTYIYPAL